MFDMILIQTDLFCHVFPVDIKIPECIWERSGSVVECSKQRGCLFEPRWPRHLVSLRHINPCLLLVQPRKTCPDIAKNCLFGGKESNQTNIKWHRTGLFNVPNLRIKKKMSGIPSVLIWIQIRPGI